MTQGSNQNDDFFASMLRAQIASLQDLLYCVENGVANDDYLLESVKTLGRKNRQIISLCEQIKNLNHALAK